MIGEVGKYLSLAKFFIMYIAKVARIRLHMHVHLCICAVQGRKDCMYLNHITAFELMLQRPSLM